MDQAEGDLAHARSDLRRGFYDWACFSTQQATEKAVKAVLYRMGLEVWGYSVADLLEVLAERQEVPAGLREAALELDKAYIPTRYPDALPAGSPRRRYTRREARRLITHADAILRFCQGLLSGLSAG